MLGNTALSNFGGQCKWLFLKRETIFIASLNTEELKVLSSEMDPAEIGLIR
jgi:hypothetical protein